MIQEDIPKYAWKEVDWKMGKEEFCGVVLKINLKEHLNPKDSELSSISYYFMALKSGTGHLTLDS